MYKRSEALKEIRKIAKDNGMTFKKQDATLNRNQLYMFVNRFSGAAVVKNFTFWNAYENCLS